MPNLLLLGISAALVSNLVFGELLGIESLASSSKSLKSAVGAGVAVVFVMIFASAITWGMYVFLQFIHSEFLITFIFIVVVAGFVQLCKLFLNRKIPKIGKPIGGYFTPLTVNSAILGVALFNINQFMPPDGAGGFAHIMVNGALAGVGFLIAVVILAGVRERLELCSNVPKAFRGIPIAMICAGLIAVAFLGLAG